MTGFQLFGYMVTGVKCGAGNAHSSRTPDFAPFGEFMISPIHYIYITEFVSFRTTYTD